MFPILAPSTFKNQEVVKYVLLVLNHCDYLHFAEQHIYGNLPPSINYLE